MCKSTFVFSEKGGDIKLRHLTSVENDMKPERNLIESTYETPDII